jgi:hypothetical protein
VCCRSCPLTPVVAMLPAPTWPTPADLVSKQQALICKVREQASFTFTQASSQQSRGHYVAPVSLCTIPWLMSLNMCKSHSPKVMLELPSHSCSICAADVLQGLVHCLVTTWGARRSTAAQVGMCRCSAYVCTACMGSQLMSPPKLQSSAALLPMQ